MKIQHRISQATAPTTAQRNLPAPGLLGRRIAFSTIVQYAGKALQLVLGVMTLKLISNFLSLHGYGVYSAITEYALFFSVAANLGIFANLVRKMADQPGEGKIFVNAMVLRILTGGIFFVLAILYLALRGADAVFLLGSGLFLGSLFLDFVTSVCDGMLQANYMMGRATLALALGRLVQLSGVYFIVQRFGGLAAPSGVTAALLLFFGMTMAASFLTAGLSFYFVQQKFARRNVSLHLRIDVAFLREIFRTSLPYGLIFFVNNLYFRFVPDFLGHQFLSSAQFGAFNVSFRIAQVLSLLSTFLMFSALPGLKQYIALKQWKKAGILYKKLAWILLAGGIAIVAFGSLFGPKIIELLTHKKYFLPEFWFLLPMMLILAAISYGYDLVLISLFALQKDWWLLKCEVLSLIIAVLFFAPAFLVESMELKLFLTVFGAIVGETTMLTMGVLRLKKIFKKELHLSGEFAIIGA